MKYNETITLRDGRSCVLRNGKYEDGQALLDVFIKAHEETDFLLTYPDEVTYTAEQEAEYLQKKTDSEDSVEILAEVDGVIVGTAGIECIGDRYKTRHRADFGISVIREYWRLGIGRALTSACIACAKSAGYSQLELEAVAENEGALALYRSEGFTEYGRNPRGFKSRLTGYQEVVYMRLELD